MSIASSSRMTIRDGSWFFIENIGNLVCPAEFVIGEDIKIVVASAAEGSDKPYKYPAAFARSAACGLTKIDLARRSASTSPTSAPGSRVRHQAPPCSPSMDARARV